MKTSESKSGSCTKMTRHAITRMRQRGIPTEFVELVMEFGRMVCTRGAVVHAIGRKEVERYREEQIDLSDCESVQVVCSMDGAVITAYRNENFRSLRSDRPRKRSRPHQIRIASRA